MRREPEFLEEQEATLVYIAKKLREALALEQALTSAGVDYVVETDDYVGGIVFRSSRTGAFFYVRPDAAGAARRVMRQNGYRPFEPVV